MPYITSSVFIHNHIVLTRTLYHIVLEHKASIPVLANTQILSSYTEPATQDMWK